MKKKFLFVAVLLCCGFVSFSQSAKEKQYLDFLYEYMPMSDRIDYSKEYYQRMVSLSIEARESMPWGKIVPEELFRHFVLVYRVNNEDLDTARAIMFKQLKDRVKNLSMYEAALEVNHWCHEYVNYKASDGRTSAPLASMRTSWGRCGEESTFAVSALRSVCIPARQCYTPRWAHTDDNHAWVEVWIDGKWYYLGACEPEPKLNVAWFTAPAKRAMMVHTTVFGKYNGKEETNFIAKKYSKINLLENYAPTKKLSVKVVDDRNRPVKDADVSFGLYNYAEYYPLAKLKTNAKGLVSLTTGFGDLVIWVKTDKVFTQKEARAEDNMITIKLPQTNKYEDKENILELTPPIPLPIETIPEELIQKNNIRLVEEDSMRNAYIASFPKTDNEYIKNAWGNYAEIEKVVNMHYPDNRNIDILGVIYEKDLRDTKADILKDHLDNFIVNKNYSSLNREDINRYILNPRIQLEILTAWRGFIRNYFKTKFENPKDIAIWIDKNIKINNEDNYYNVPISPKGVITSKSSDNKSKQIAFVAIARSFGFAARYEWATGRGQYMDENNEWQYAFKDEKSKLSDGKSDRNNCMLIVNNDEHNTIKPEYYYKFTIQKLVNNSFQTLDYEYDPHFLKFPDTLMLSNGHYRMIVGNRNSEGKVFVKETYFSLNPEYEKNITITIPEAKENIQVYGSVDLDYLIQDISTKNVTLSNVKSLMKSHKAIILATIDPYKEPSRHLLVDIAKDKVAFDEHNDVALVLVLDKSLLNSDFSTDVFPPMNKNTYILIDENKRVEKEILDKTSIKFLNNYPILALIRQNGDIVYFSQGYKISSGEEILKNINKL